MKRGLPAQLLSLLSDPVAHQAPRPGNLFRHHPQCDQITRPYGPFALLLGGEGIGRQFEPLVCFDEVLGYAETKRAGDAEVELGVREPLFGCPPIPAGGGREILCHAPAGIVELGDVVLRCRIARFGKPPPDAQRRRVVLAVRRSQAFVERAERPSVVAMRPMSSALRSSCSGGG